MSDSTPDGADGRLESLVRSLRDAPGIERYPDVFPRLGANHLPFLADARRTPRREAAALLTAACRDGPLDPAAVEQLYRQRGEMPALRAVAGADTVAQATTEWQRDVNQLLGDVEDLAILCDREGVGCSKEDLTWAKRVNGLREQLSARYADNPASQKVLITECRNEMQFALDGEKQHLQDRLRKACGELEQNRNTLDENAVRDAGEYADSTHKLIDDNNLIIALRKVARLEELVSGRTPRVEDGREPRLPLGQRRNPLGGGFFHFEDLAATAKQGADEVEQRGLAGYFPDETALEEATDSAGFLVLHSRRVPEWGSYFAALREWLGLSESRSAPGGRRLRVRRLQQLETPNLESKGEKRPGRWVFLTTEPWQGAPFYEDVSARPRLVAVVRLAVPEADRNRASLILKYVSQTLRDLLVVLPAETADEQRFRRDGLAIVLLPGEILSSKAPKLTYDQFRQQVQLEKLSWAGRIAYLDDLDLLRLLPGSADDRYRALLELALPRFPDALSQTYQSSDAVRPRMFFGRTDELARLENGATVVFSGRKIGKSSLLHRLRAQCGSEADQRAVMVGCSGVASGRSWTVLREIERELERLLQQEAPEAAAPAVHPAPASIDAPSARAMQAAKERFRSVIDDVMRKLEVRNVRRLYVLLDEADNFVRAEREETSGGKDPRAAVSWLLRDLQTSSYNGRLRFIFAGYDQIGRVFRDPGLGQSAFGNWGEQPLKLGPLEPRDAKDLVVKPLTALGMLLSDDLAERILDYTSGHASLIQAFCRKLAERVRENQSAWPLNDVTVEFKDVQTVADDQRGSGDQNYRQLLEQTLGLNLDVARAYPLKLLFLALASPTGLGAGRTFGSEAFRFEDALEQVRSEEGEPATDLTPNLVLDSLDLLAQLGLLEDVSDGNGRAFRFKARHYVNVLRTQNGFRSQLRQTVEEWRQSGRRANQVEPRHIWTLPDSDFWKLRQKDPRPAVVVGLPGSGRDYLADMLASPGVDRGSPLRLRPNRPDFETTLEALFADPPGQLVVVADPDGRVAWETLAGRLRRAETVGLQLRWVGGPQLAWEFAGDWEAVLQIDEPYGLGPLTAAELEPWAARELGGEGPASTVSVPDGDRGPLLDLTSGLLPVLEMFRAWLLKSHGHLPDPLRLSHAEEFRDVLERDPAAVEPLAERLAGEIPRALRVGLHDLFRGAHEWNMEVWKRSDLDEICPHLRQLGEEDVTRLLDAVQWLRLLPDGVAPGQVRVPYHSVLGLLIRHPRFASL